MAAYRDRYGITTRTPLGPAPDSDAQKIDAARAKAALARLATSLVPNDTTSHLGLRGARARAWPGPISLPNVAGASYLGS